MICYIEIYNEIIALNEETGMYICMLAVCYTVCICPGTHGEVDDGRADGSVGEPV